MTAPNTVSVHDGWSNQSIQAYLCYNTFMRITIKLPDDIHARVAVDALRKPRNSKEAVITEILRAHYGGAPRDELILRALAWRIDPGTARGIAEIRRHAKERWK